MSESTAATPPRRSLLRALLWTFVAIVVLSIFVDVIGGLLEAAWYLVMGWFVFAKRVLPQVQINWGGVATAAGCVAGVLVLTQFIGRGLITGWGVRYTLFSVAIVVLIFIAGTAAVGLTHQTVWLARSEEPIFVYGGRSRETANRIKCQSNVSHLVKAARQYAQEHGGRFPDTLGQLAEVDEWNSLYACPSGVSEGIPRDTPLPEKARLIDAGQTSYGYVGRGLDLSAPSDMPIVVEAVTNHDGYGLNIGFADGTADWFSAEQAPAVLSKYPRPTTRPAR